MSVLPFVYDESYPPSLWLGPPLTSLSPDTAVVTGADFTLTVYGSGFTATSVIYFDGAPMATTPVSALEVSA